MNKLINMFWRIVAVFASSGLRVIGAGGLVGVTTGSAILMAGTLGVATVVEALAHSYLNDGKWSDKEINDAFAKVDRSSK